MLCLGAISIRLIWTGGFGWFVQQHMKLPLAASAVALLLFGTYEAVAGAREEQRDPSAIRRAVGPTVGWLLILPLLVLVSVAPTGLGAAAADRVDPYTPTEPSGRYPPLDTSAGPVEMRVFDFLDRAIWDPERSLEGVTVRLEGLVVNNSEVPDGFRLTRFMVSCCAADGIPLQVTVRGVDEPLDNNTWVTVDLVWRPPEVPYQEITDDWVVEADLVSVTVVGDIPNNPYESPY